MTSINRNFVCLVHRTHRRAEVQAQPLCPTCRQEMALMPLRMPMPNRTHRGWKRARVVISKFETGHPRFHVRWPRGSYG